MCKISMSRTCLSSNMAYALCSSYHRWKIHLDPPGCKVPKRGCAFAKLIKKSNYACKKGLKYVALFTAFPLRLVSNSRNLSYPDFACIFIFQIPSSIEQNFTVYSKSMVRLKLINLFFNFTFSSTDFQFISLNLNRFFSGDSKLMHRLMAIVVLTNSFNSWILDCFCNCRGVIKLSELWHPVTQEWVKTCL